jgi:Predicted integral membrane protein
MKSTQHERPRIDKKRQEPAPAFIDVNSDCQSIVINAPVAEVYRRCLQFEEFPRFITSIRKVEKINDTRFSFTSIINGQEVKTVITIMMRIPDRRIAWQGVSDHFRVGVVFLDPLDDDTTRVTVKVRSIIEPVLLTGALHSYLIKFTRFVEEKTTR